MSVFLIDPGRPIRSEVQRVFLGELSPALHELGDPSMDPDAVVHSVRKRLKRMRAVLRLVRSELGPTFGPANRTLRDAGRRLSGLRDSRVAVDTVELIGELYRAGLSKKARARLAEVRESLVRGSAGRSRKDGYADIRADVISDLEAALDWPRTWKFERPGFGAVEFGLARTYGSGRDAMRVARQRGEAEAFHAWRRRVKDHWHHTQLVGPLEVPARRGRGERLHQLSETLGQLQDLQVLGSAVGSGGAGAKTMTLLDRLIARERARLGGRSLELGRSLYWFRPETLVDRYASAWQAARGPAA